MPARPLKSTDLDTDPNDVEGLDNPFNSDAGTGEVLPGNNPDTVDNAASDLDGADEDRPDADNPNDVGEDEGLDGDLTEN